MKYIPVEKLITEIEALKRRKGFLPLENTEITEAYMARGVQFTCDDIMNIVTSLQQEQPTLSSNLDEAAKKWKEEHFRREYYQIPKDAMSRSFKAGAEWMAGQGETFNGYISVKGKRSLIAIEGKSDMCKYGDEVVVQIRKK